MDSGNVADSLNGEMSLYIKIETSDDLDDKRSASYHQPVAFGTGSLSAFFAQGDHHGLDDQQWVPEVVFFVKQVGLESVQSRRDLMLGNSSANSI